MLKGILRLKPYGVKELCYLYEITDKTLKRWLKPFNQDIGTRNGRYYNVIQVEIIFTKLGVPRDVREEEL